MKAIEKEKLWEEYQKNPTPKLREQLIIEYAQLVRLVAGRLSMYLGHNVEYDDLVSYGIFGLIDAIDKFNLEKNVEVNMINCTIDKLKTTEPIMTEDILPPKSFINALKLLNTRLCEGTYDIVGTLKPIIKESICHKTCILRRKRSCAPIISLITLHRTK